MIEYFHTDEQSRILTKIDEERPGCWIALFEPTADELSSVARRFSIDEDDMRAPLDLEEVSRIERNVDYTMFIVDTPMHVKNAERKRYTTIPIGIFETSSHVISVCSVYRVPLIAILKSWRNVHDTSDIKAFASDILHRFVRGVLFDAARDQQTPHRAFRRHRQTRAQRPRRALCPGCIARLHQDLAHHERQHLRALPTLCRLFLYAGIPRGSRRRHHRKQAGP